MKLGNASQISIGTSHMDASSVVYDKLGFRRISEGEVPYHFIQYTDDSCVIILNEDGSEHMGLRYFSSEMDKIAAELRTSGTSFINEKKDPSGRFFQGDFITPDGVQISLVHFSAKGMPVPKINLRDFSEADCLDSSKYPNKKIGIFGEYSVPVKDLAYSLAYWDTIGFAPLSINREPYPWAVLTDGMTVIGLHQTREFRHQAITYFAPDMRNRIEAIKRNGLEDNIKKFSGSEDENIHNAVLTTMENQKFFLFSF